MHLRRHVLIVATAVMLVAFGFIIGTAASPSMAAGHVSLPALAQPAIPGSPDLDLASHEQYLANLYNTVSPSVVSINVRLEIPGHRGVTDTYGAATGSGFVISDQGYIVTNNHVVESAAADGIEVNFHDGTIVRGTLVGTDPDSDLAVIQVDLPTSELPPVTFGDSDHLVIGQTALAIGSPFGQRWTLTYGVVSALDRTIQGLTNYSIGSVIQTDAAINPGNSGGPLFDLKGEVIGVNSQIASETRANSGVGFAIPSNLVKRVSEQLINEGHVNYSYLGITSAPELDIDMIETLHLPNNLRGVVVASVLPNGPASQAGLHTASDPVMVRGVQIPRYADVITQIDGEPIVNMNDLISYLARNTQPGDTINLTIWRDGDTLTLPVELSARPS